MRALPERAVAGFTDALIAERFPFLDADQQASTSTFVLSRWRVASQPVRLGTGAVATALGAAAWSMTAVGSSGRDAAWGRVVRLLGGSGLFRRPLPGIAELSQFVVSLATAYAADRWPDAALPSSIHASPPLGTPPLGTPAS